MPYKRIVDLRATAETGKKDREPALAETEKRGWLRLLSASGIPAVNGFAGILVAVGLLGVLVDPIAGGLALGIGSVLLALFWRHGLYLYLSLVLLTVPIGLAFWPSTKHGLAGMFGLAALMVSAMPWGLLVLSDAFRSFSGRSDEQLFWLLLSFVAVNVCWAVGNAILRRRAGAPGERGTAIKPRSATAAHVALAWFMVGLVLSMALALWFQSSGFSMLSAVWIALVAASLHCTCVILLPIRLAFSLGSTMIVAVGAFVIAYGSFPYVHEWLDSVFGPLTTESRVEWSPAGFLLMSLLASQIVFWGSDRVLKGLSTYLPVSAIGWVVLFIAYFSLVAAAWQIWRVEQPERLSAITCLARR